MEKKTIVSNNEKAYKAPVVKVIEFSAESLICQSPGTGEGFVIDPDVDDNE